MNEADTRVVEQTLRINARPETVWRYWTDPQRMGDWWGAAADLDPRPGGACRVPPPPRRRCWRGERTARFGVEATVMLVEQAIQIPVADATVDGDLIVPDDASGLVAFAHGSGSSRQSPRNRSVAAGLRDRGLGTLLMDLLTIDEEAVDARTRHLRFDIGLLAGRLEAAAAWLATQAETRALPIGYFGASTGAAAALVAAARRPVGIAAVVSRGGRPDLAGDFLPDVQAPTLLIVGGRDHVVIELNREAHDRMRVERELVIVPGATHLFEEPGALDEVVRLAGDWFALHLGSGGSPR